MKVTRTLPATLRTLGPVVCRFRVFPERRRGRPRTPWGTVARPWSYQVIVFRDKRAMQAYYRAQQRKIGAPVGSMDFAAVTTAWENVSIGPRGGKRVDPDMGRILIALPFVGGGVVSHEMGHAALGWARRVGVRVDSPAKGHREAQEGEERFCFVLGNLTRQFWVRFYPYQGRR